MKELTLNQIKKIELNILIEFDKICKKNNLKYSLAGGTLLGAIRHKGFIPWDDDIDVFMMREDYNKFIALYNNDSNYKLITYKNTKNYNYFFAKLVDSSTKIIEEHNKIINDMGVYIDIFPIDFFEDSKEESEKILNKLSFKKYLGVASNWRHFYINKNRSIFRQIPRLFFYFLSRFFNSNKTYSKMETKMKNSAKKFSGCLCGVYGKNEIMPTEIFESVSEIEFEGHMFFAITSYDYYLKQFYNEYLKLPPKEKQITHHTFKAYNR